MEVGVGGRREENMFSLAVYGPGYCPEGCARTHGVTGPDANWAQIWVTDASTSTTRSLCVRPLERSADPNIHRIDKNGRFASVCVGPLEMPLEHTRMWWRGARRARDILIIQIMVVLLDYVGVGEIDRYFMLIVLQGNT